VAVFFMSHTKQNKNGHLPRLLGVTRTQTLLSRQAMNCTPSTLAFYSNVEIFTQLFDYILVKTILVLLLLLKQVRQSD
jgi:hypothetical protein